MPEPSPHLLGWRAGGNAERRKPYEPNPFAAGSPEATEWEEAFETGRRDEHDRMDEKWLGLRMGGQRLRW